MKVLVVLSFDMSDDIDFAAQHAAGLIERIDPMSLLGFDGRAQIVVPPHSAELLAWLEEE